MRGKLAGVWGRRARGTLYAAILVAAGCVSRREPTTSAIHIRAFQFALADTVQTGDTVVWINDDVVPHTATDLGKSFDSGEIESGHEWRFVARAPGTFAYECTLHPTMRGTLVVR
jgi:plastocyanin